MNGNLMIQNAAQVVTCSGFAAKAGPAMNNLTIIENGAVRMENGLVAEVGAGPDMAARWDAAKLQSEGYDVIDAAGRAVLPGFVDAHTHFVFGGHRAEEFGRRLRGESYMEIMARGGGIATTVAATRAASQEELVKSGIQHLDTMLSFGVTTVEGKSGYGLDRDTEIRQLEVMAKLNAIHYVDVVPTFLGAHAVPPEYKGREDAFIDFMAGIVLPEVAERRLAEFCDVFCEQNVFSVAQSRRLLEKAKNLGLKIKLHADEIAELGGAELAAELGAVSADHLLQASDAGIRGMAAAGVVATLLPATAFSLKEPYARGRFMIDQGCAVALATDLNPGSCFTESVPLVAVLAALYMQLTPEEIITALTLNGAAAVGRAAEIGSIDPGKAGDLVILADPSYEFIPYHLAVNRVEKVIKEGNVVYDACKGGIIYC